MAKRPFFLISNDDGVHAPGIRALAAAVEPLGDVLVVAPHVERSGMGQALSLTVPLRLEQLAPTMYAVEGTPTDCVMLAMSKLLHGRRPDFVLSGINRGANIGQDTLYSGTVAAAMEGCLHGIPAIAFSLAARAFAYEEYQAAIHVVRAVMKDTRLTDAAKGGVLNVNIPGGPASALKGFAVSTLGRRIYDNQVVESVDPRGRPYFWIGGGGVQHADIPGSDCNLLSEGYVTLTALKPEHHHETVNDALRRSCGATFSAPFR